MGRLRRVEEVRIRWGDEWGTYRQARMHTHTQLDVDCRDGDECKLFCT